jgi:predicted GNAT family acetyltransferase
VAARLTRALLDDLALHDRQVVPACGFVSAYIGRHPEYRCLVSGTDAT